MKLNNTLIVVYYNDDDRVEDILLKPSVTESMFTAWLQANNTYPDASNLTYSEFIGHFVYVRRQRIWKPRKRGYTIGRLIWVPPSTGELYYFRMMLTCVQGPKSYEDIMKVKGIQYFSYRDACFAMGFLQDDKEYIKAIQESKDW
ncbi:helicase-like protein, partial [Trifolium medium]|nr:helicase-like protein [Trifolium medium]